MERVVKTHTKYGEKIYASCDMIDYDDYTKFVSIKAKDSKGDVKSLLVTSFIKHINKRAKTHDFLVEYLMNKQRISSLDNEMYLASIETLSPRVLTGSGDTNGNYRKGYGQCILDVAFELYKYYGLERKGDDVGYMTGFYAPTAGFENASRKFYKKNGIDIIEKDKYEKFLYKKIDINDNSMLIK